MTRLLNSVTYPRCPSCGCLAIAAWPVEHRPNCPHLNTDPSDWRNDDH